MRDFSDLILTKLSKGFTKGRKASLHRKQPLLHHYPPITLHMKEEKQLTAGTNGRKFK